MSNKIVLLIDKSKAKKNYFLCSTFLGGFKSPNLSEVSFKPIFFVGIITLLSPSWIILSKHSNPNFVSSKYDKQYPTVLQRIANPPMFGKIKHKHWLFAQQYVIMNFERPRRKG